MGYARPRSTGRIIALTFFRHMPAVTVYYGRHVADFNSTTGTPPHESRTHHRRGLADAGRHAVGFHVCGDQGRTGFRRSQRADFRPLSNRSADVSAVADTAA